MPLNSLHQRWLPRHCRICNPSPWWLRECAFLVTRRYSRLLASKSSVWTLQLRTSTRSGVLTLSPKKASKHPTKLPLRCQEPVRTAYLQSLPKWVQRPWVILTRARQPSSTTLCWRGLSLAQSLVVTQPWRLCQLSIFVKVLLFFKMVPTSFLVGLTVKRTQ